MSGYDVDLLVLGSGPGGQRAAVAAARLGHRVAVVERRSTVGGVCVNTGTIPSKTLREVVVQLTGLHMRDLYGRSYRAKDPITISDLTARTEHVIGREIEVVRSQLARNGVVLVIGTARFVDDHSVAVLPGDGVERRISGERIIIATGTQPARPATVAFDDVRILDSDGILGLQEIPRSLVVVGAGMIGIEYASMFAALGTRVTVVESRERMLDVCDAEVVGALESQLRDLSVCFRFGETVCGVRAGDDGTVTTLDGGEGIAADAVMYSAGRRGATDELDLPTAGLSADDRGRIKVGSTYQTEVEHIYAVGDVIGYPALAATSMEQGRLAACHALGEPANSLVALQPTCIYTIPEISYVGRTEEDLTTSDIPYEVGRSRYRELARGQIIGEPHGMLKVLVCRRTRRLLGVHVVGSQATELVHLGQAIMTCDGTVDQLVDTVFNYPTLSEAYKVAALDAVNRLRAAEPASSSASPPWSR